MRKNYSLGRYEETTGSMDDWSGGDMTEGEGKPRNENPLPS